MHGRQQAGQPATATVRYCPPDTLFPERPGLSSTRAVPDKYTRDGYERPLRRPSPDRPPWILFVLLGLEKVGVEERRSPVPHVLKGVGHGPVVRMRAPERVTALRLDE